MRHADNLDGTFTNPVIFADYPDPDIIRVGDDLYGDDFYMVSSSFTAVPGIPICHSKDLVNWRIIGHTYQELPRSNPAYSMTNGQAAYRGGSWAPCIRHHAGKFYICFNTPAEGFFMAIAARPEGPYELTSFGFELYDPSLLFDDDGRVYLSHGAGGISVTELTADARAVKSEPISIHQSAFGSPLEGSHFYKRNGFYYICVTSRGYNGIQICLRSANVYGPYRARVLCADDMNYAGAGLHQGGFVDLSNGQSWFFLFQDRDFLGRLPVLQPVRWEDDWPMLGDPDNYGKAFITCSKPQVPGASEVALPEGPDDFDSTTLGLQWHWNHNPDASRWSLSQRPGYLRLHAAVANDFLHARNTLAQKIVGPESTATATLDTSGLLPGDLAGLAILGIPYAFIAASRGDPEGPGLGIVMVNDGAVVASITAPKATRIHFRCHAGSDGLARFSWSDDGEAFAPLGDALTMQFTVKTFLGNKFVCFAITSSQHRMQPDLPISIGSSSTRSSRRTSTRPGVRFRPSPTTPNAGPTHSESPTNARRSD